MTQKRARIKGRKKRKFCCERKDGRKEGRQQSISFRRRRKERSKEGKKEGRKEGGGGPTNSTLNRTSADDPRLTAKQPKC